MLPRCACDLHDSSSTSVDVNHLGESGGGLVQRRDRKFRRAMSLWRRKAALS
jgi:hypothetical protein